MLIAVALIASVSLTAVLYAAGRVVETYSLQRSADDLQTAKAAFDRLVESRARFAAAQTRLIAELPVFRAHMDPGSVDRRGCRHDFRDGRRVSRQARGRLLPRHRRPGPADRRSTRAGEDGRAADHRGDEHGARRPLGVRHRPLRTEPVSDRVRAGHVRRRSARHDHGGLQARRRGGVGAGARDELRGEPGVRGQSAVRQQPPACLARGSRPRC